MCLPTMAKRWSMFKLLEHTLKSILLLHRFFEGASAGPMVDATFQHRWTNRVLQPYAASSWISCQSSNRGRTPFHAHAEEALFSMARLHRLAHIYLVETPELYTCR